MSWWWEGERHKFLEALYKIQKFNMYIYIADLDQLRLKANHTYMYGFHGVKRAQQLPCIRDL